MGGLEGPTAAPPRKSKGTSERSTSSASVVLTEDWVSRGVAELLDLAINESNKEVVVVGACHGPLNEGSMAGSVASGADTVEVTSNELTGFTTRDTVLFADSFPNEKKLELELGPSSSSSSLSSSGIPVILLVEGAVETVAGLLATVCLAEGGAGLGGFGFLDRV